MTLRKRYIITHHDTYIKEDEASRRICRIDKGAQADLDHFAEVGLSIATLTQEAAEQLQSLSEIAEVEEDCKISIPKLTKPLPPSIKPEPGKLPWNIEMISATKFWDEDIKGDGIKVAIIDTGIKTDHPALIESVKGGISFVGENPCDWEDKIGHGTQCAGIIGARDVKTGVFGVAPSVSLYAVKITDDDDAYFGNTIRGMKWAYKENMDVVSISNSFPLWQVKRAKKEGGVKGLERIVKLLTDRGCIIVAAVGNDGRGEADYPSVGYPARADGVISVAAVDEDGEWWDESSWEESSNAVDLCAPGVNVSTTWLDGFSLTDAGTSFACPHVAGAAALLVEYGRKNNLALTTKQIRRILRESANDLLLQGTDPETGVGLLNCERAFQLVSEGS